MKEFLIENQGHVLCVLLLVARLTDVISTRLATPTLKLESNPIAKRFGWPFIFLSVLVCLIPYWSPAIGMIALVVSLWVSSDNIGRLWFIRALGESEFKKMVEKAQARASFFERLMICFAKAGCLAVMGVVLCVLTHASPEPPLSFWFGVGILSYAFLNLSIGVSRFSKAARSIAKMKTVF